MASLVTLVAVAVAALQGLAAAAICPLNFGVLDGFSCDPGGNSCGTCSDAWNRLNFVVAEYARRTQVFLLPQQDASACIDEFKMELPAMGQDANLSTACGITASVLMESSARCPQIRTVADYRLSITPEALEELDSACSSFSTRPACGRCVSRATSASSTAEEGCLRFSFIYAAGIASRTGPLDSMVASCLFYLRDADAQDQQRRRRVIILSTVVPAGTILVVLIIAIWYLRQRNLQLRDNEHSDRTFRMMHGPVKFSIQELRLATAGFSSRNKIGSGGFSNVFKGVLGDGTLIAVKRFKNCSSAGDAEFINEVEIIGSVRHRNLAGLLGWCVSSSSETRHERFIVYEFMPNGSLQDHLSVPGQSVICESWELRKAIILGVARGLAYLHGGAEARIIHRDVKSSNILLDESMTPRISDMGLAKFVPEGVSSFRTGTVGTQGYVAPEYVLYEQLTDKSDVYSFGIVMLEVLTGNKALVPPLSTPIADWAWDLIQRDKLWDVFSGVKLAGLDEECLVEMLRFLFVAFLCAHPYVVHRPSMLQAVKMLEDGTGVPQKLPERPLGFEVVGSGAFNTEAFSLSTISSRE
ncbi:probable LRR receptor-like serine/threonine-protein kinase RKF3 [Selaginella moellendorffii]|nr:probable LRR receptor-like serine/threonine-protein kinase RKF3 [Selaginella moellendorffii]XP_024534563.1 probable LRR receptor-like serine/threonine-protein kinase RKF3 [Selaginella moellendorffii]XP_024534565.1 probable LRR receptor-like serine/threonine-protein kinase RKF3 [Selaginella moellendorffii]XP_024534566.1 probable LRR receptor-like serine/threonine-protein kinase RKF3 [Selaginella moellendorffii]XP_024534567.1 probable LRR receptor-like serine/threonine-protein kinase RKF3 [Sel|eukprot:XP_024534562.1 probable LRR receptor-like serine/threonine-protein kinase RKF3 [Selaginella moellendorffii]